MTQNSSRNCQFCSEISKANGEDPIGTARAIDQWLLVELPQPWTPQLLKADPRFEQLVELGKRLFLTRGIVIQPIFIAPDPEYSRPGQTRVIHYRRPDKQFTRYEKQEFIVPTPEFPDLIAAVLKRSTHRLADSRFQIYRQGKDSGAGVDRGG